jgi:hypothetical protein
MTAFMRNPPSSPLRAALPQNSDLILCRHSRLTFAITSLLVSLIFVCLVRLAILHTRGQPQEPRNRPLNYNRRIYQVRAPKVGNRQQEQATKEDDLPLAFTLTNQESLRNTHKERKPNITAAFADGT